MTNNDDAFITGQAFAPISKLTVIQITGNDRASVLNNFCTADIKRLEPEHGTEAFITDVRGRTIGHVCVFQLAEELLLIGTAGQGATLASHIDRYIIREDATVTDHSEGYVGWLVSGQQRAPSIIEQTMAQPPSLASGSLPVTSAPARWFQLPWTSSRDGLVLAASSVADAVRQWMGEQGLGESSVDAIELARIEAGFPVYGIDCSDANLPQEIDRNGQAISFTKGCYLGQETVARLDALGQVQKKLVRMTISGDVVPGLGTKLIEADKPCGEIRSASWSPRTGSIVALGYVRRKWFEPGSRLQVADSQQTATVI